MSTQPSCFGKSWDPTHVECKGGLDPAYSNPRTGTKLRDECSWFQQCSHKVQGRQMSAPLLPPAALLRIPSAPPPRPVMTQPYSPPRPTAYSAPPTHYSLPTAPQQPMQAQPVHHPVAYTPPQHQQITAQQNYVPAHVAQFGPAYVPMPFQNPGSQMSQYLTVPEPVTDNVHWLTRLLREMFRAGIKAIAHQLSAHVDSHSFQRHDKQ